MRYEDAVVVGVADPVPDRFVLEWAAREATAREAPLWVCHFEEWLDRDLAAVPLAPELEPRSIPEGIVVAAVETVRADFRDLPVTGALGYGRAAPSLLEMSDHAGIIVLGPRGTGGLPGLLVGSVAAQVAAHARCPVAVVRRPPGNGPDVVVGVDGSPQSYEALCLGVAQTRRLGGRLVAVHAFSRPPVDVPFDPAVAAVERLDEALRDLERAVPDVKIERRVEEGSAARVLVRAAEDAAALVVGARGLGGFAGLVLGSVSQQVLRHAPGPVLIAH